MRDALAETDERPAAEACTGTVLNKMEKES